MSYGASLGSGNESLFTWPRWPPCPYMVKSLKNLLQNQKADDLETWYAASGASSTKFVQMMTLGWPWPILQQVQILSLMLLYEKKVNRRFFRNYCRLCFETSNRWPKWQEVSVDIKTLSPRGCMPSALELYTCIKSLKNCIKSDYKEISLKLATNG